MKSDAVSRECIALIQNKTCNLLNKCDECKIEVNNLIEIDEMYIEYFKQLEYLLKRAETSQPA